MSWISQCNLSWYETLAVNVLKCGPIPKHIAFIMDGNRRFACKSGVKKIEGHSKGFEKLTRTLQWCLAFGIHEVTVYAFSIENFKRPQEEVDQLMSLATEKFKKLLDEREKLNEHGICIRVIGNISLLPSDLQKLIVQSMEATQHNQKAVLNIAFAYTSTEEMDHAVSEISWGMNKGLLMDNNIDEDLLEKCLYTRHSPKLDLLVRTSGEVRLSNFLLWQSAYTILYFTPVLWPEFSFWDLCKAFLHYQKNLHIVTAAQEKSAIPVRNAERNEHFLKEMELKGNQTRNIIMGSS